MTIKELAHKHSLTFFWSTIILAIIILLIFAVSLCRGGFDGRRDFRDREFYRRGDQMMDRYNTRGQYMRNQPPQEEQVLPVDNTYSSSSQTQ